MADGCSSCDHASKTPSTPHLENPGCERLVGNGAELMLNGRSRDSLETVREIGILMVVFAPLEATFADVLVGTGWVAVMFLSVSR